MRMSKSTRPSSSTAAAGWSARYCSIAWASRSGEAASAPVAMLSLPAHARAQAGDVRGVMKRVPGVHGQYLGQVNAAPLRVNKSLAEVFVGQRFQQRHPAAMQRLDQRQRAANRQAAVWQFSPGGLVVDLDGWPIFGQRRLAADVGLGVAIGDVMHHLAHRPSAFAVRRVELGIIQSGNGGPQALGQLAQGLHVRLAEFGRTAGRWGKTANWITEVVQFCHGTNLTTFTHRNETTLSNPAPAMELLWARGSY